MQILLLLLLLLLLLWMRECVLEPLLHLFGRGGGILELILDLFADHLLEHWTGIDLDKASKVVALVVGGVSSRIHKQTIIEKLATHRNKRLQLPAWMRADKLRLLYPPLEVFIGGDNRLLIRRGRVGRRT